MRCTDRLLRNLFRCLLCPTDHSIFVRGSPAEGKFGSDGVVADISNPRTAQTSWLTVMSINGSIFVKLEFISFKLASNRYRIYHTGLHFPISVGNERHRCLLLFGLRQIFCRKTTENRNIIGKYMRKIFISKCPDLRFKIYTFYG